MQNSKESIVFHPCDEMDCPFFHNFGDPLTEENARPDFRCTFPFLIPHEKRILDTRIEYEHGKIARLNFHGGVIGEDPYTEDKDDVKC